MTERVTMRDIARAVGVSPMTVSRALRDDATVQAKTRARVREAAQRLGYVYDSTAQVFRSQKSGFIAVTLPSVNNANFADTFRALSAGVEAMGLQVLLGSTNYRLEKEEHLVRQLLARNPQVLVLTGGHHTPATRDLIRNKGLPVIEMWDLPDDPLGHAVGFSNAQAMHQVVAHLAQGGRRRLGFVGASDGADLRGAARRQGVMQAAEALGLPEPKIIDAGPAPVSMRHGAAVVNRLGDGLRDLDALVCVSDPVAFGCLGACLRLGLRVPDDIAITGFGHFEVGQVSVPSITSVNVHAADIGRRVVEVMQDVLGQGTATPHRIDVGTTLVIAETT